MNYLELQDGNGTGAGDGFWPDDRDGTGDPIDYLTRERDFLAEVVVKGAEIVRSVSGPTDYLSGTALFNISADSLGLARMIEELSPRTFVHAQHTTELLSFARRCLPDGISSRLEFLYGLEQDLDEDEQPMSVGSLKCFLDFMNNNNNLREPAIAVTLDGYIEATWQQGQDAIFTIVFLPSKQAIYSFVGQDSWRVGSKYVAKGTAPYSAALRAVSGEYDTRWLFR